MPDQATTDKQSDQKQDQSQEYVIKVDGQDVKVTYEQLIEMAQKGQDYTRKTQTLAEERKELESKKQDVNDLIRLREEIAGNPSMEKAVTKVINDFRAGKTTTDKQVDKSLRKLDQLIEKTDDASQRESLNQMREIISEESGRNELLDEVKSLKAELAALKGVTTAGLSARIDGEMMKLEEKFGKEIVGKHSKDIKVMAQKYPEYINGKFSRLLYHFADESEIETALLESAKRKEKEEIKRKEKGSFVGGESQSQKVDVPRDKAGRVDWTKWISNMKSAGKFNQ